MYIQIAAQGRVTLFISFSPSTLSAWHCYFQHTMSSGHLVHPWQSIYWPIMQWSSFKQQHGWDKKLNFVVNDQRIKAVSKKIFPVEKYIRERVKQLNINYGSRREERWHLYTSQNWCVCCKAEKQRRQVKIRGMTCTQLLILDLYWGAFFPHKCETQRSMSATLFKPKSYVPQCHVLHPSQPSPLTALSHLYSV